VVTLATLGFLRFALVLVFPLAFFLVGISASYNKPSYWLDLPA
jgi:hypothetical protein